MAGWPTLGILALGRLEGGQGRRCTAQFIRSIVIRSQGVKSMARRSGTFENPEQARKIRSMF